VPDPIRRVGSHISLGGERINYQTSYQNQNSMPRTLAKQGASVNLKEISKTHFKLGNDNVEYKSNATATIGSTFERLNKLGGGVPKAIKPTKTAIHLGQDANKYQTS